MITHKEREMISMRFCAGSLGIGSIGFAFTEESHVCLVHNSETCKDPAEDEYERENGISA
jgi:hypothetical protein